MHEIFKNSNGATRIPLIDLYLLTKLIIIDNEYVR